MANPHLEALHRQIPHELLAPLEQIAASWVGTAPGGISTGVSAVAQTTDQKIDVWVDGTSGSDANDGLTETTAFQTIEKAASVFKYLLLGPNTKWLVIHLRGTLDPSDVPFYFRCSGGYELGNFTRIIIDGGTDVTTVLASTVSDINGTDPDEGAYIGLTTLGATDDQYRGYWLVLESGPQAGTRYLIRTNTPTTFYLLETGPAAIADPGVGTSFRIERPTTTITAAPWSFKNLGARVDGFHELYMQNLYFTGGAGMTHDSDEDYNSQVVFSHIIHEVSGSPLLHAASFGNTGPRVKFSGDLWDVSGATPTVSTAERLGVSQVGLSLSGMILNNCTYGDINYSVIPEFWTIYTKAIRFSASAIGVWNCLHSSCGGNAGFTTGIHSAYDGDSPGVPTRFGGYRAAGAPSTPVYPGVILHSSTAWFNKTIFDWATFGVELIHSNMVVREVVGANNSLGGVYAHGASGIDRFKLFGSGDSTLSGNAGTVEVSEDGATQVGTWAGLNIATPDCVMADLETYIGPPWAG